MGVPSRVSLSLKPILTFTLAFHAMQTSAQLNTNQQLSDLQLSQVLATLQLGFEDPKKCYGHHLFFRKRRATGMGMNVRSTNEFWRSPTFTKLSSRSRPEPTMVIVKGGFTSRVAMQDFGVDVIQALTTAGVPTIWALTSGEKSRSNSVRSTTDLMRCLTYQVLRLGGVVATEKQMAWRYSQFHTSQTEREWLGLFEQVALNLSGGQLYIIVDLATVQLPVGDIDGTKFFQEFHRMLSEVSRQPAGTKLKVILLVYESDWSALMSSKVSKYMVAVKPVARKRNQGKAMRHAVKKHFS